MGQFVRLAYGVRSEGALVQGVDIRPLTGADELWLAEAGGPPPRRKLGLAARLLSPEAPPAQALAAGDLELLLRSIAAEAIAGTAEATFPCPAACGETIDLAIPLAELAVPAPEPSPPGGTHPHAGARIRVPTAADLAAAMDAPDPAAALAAACLVEGSLSRPMLADAIARLDPNAECRVETACPGCGAPMALPVDALALLTASIGDILAEVDRLASRYGWSEADILALPRARRQRYLALAAERMPA
jgi:hypothetical protein